MNNEIQQKMRRKIQLLVYLLCAHPFTAQQIHVYHFSSPSRIEAPDSEHETPDHKLCVNWYILISLYPRTPRRHTLCLYIQQLPKDLLPLSRNLKWFRNFSTLTRSRFRILVFLPTDRIHCIASLTRRHNNS